MTPVLLGIVSLDIYTRTNLVRPGGGALHNAFHLRQLGCEPLLLTRLGRNQAEPFFRFFQRHYISTLINQVVEPGESASIQLDIQPSGEALISNFKLGVWENFHLTPFEESILTIATNLHLVLTPPIVPEFIRLSQEGKLKLNCISADFLSFVDFSVESFSQLLPYLDVAFIGWKGKLNHPTLTAIGQVARKHGVLVVITLGERGIQVFDCRSPENSQTLFFEIERVTVQGNTNGCGDAFIAYFLARYWQDCQLEPAIAQGKLGGRLATEWRYALPDSAY
jgi:sugar/nucleoside kinase (ribokinase family)